MCEVSSRTADSHLTITMHAPARRLSSRAQQNAFLPVPLTRRIRTQQGKLRYMRLHDRHGHRIERRPSQDLGAVDVSATRASSTEQDRYMSLSRSQVDVLRASILAEPNWIGEDDGAQRTLVPLDEQQTSSATSIRSLRSDASSIERACSTSAGDRYEEQEQNITIAAQQSGARSKEPDKEQQLDSVHTVPEEVDARQAVRSIALTRNWLADTLFLLSPKQRLMYLGH